MRDACARAGLLEEQRDDVAVRLVAWIEDLERDVAIEVHVARGEDVAKRSLAQLLAKLVLACPSAGGQHESTALWTWIHDFLRSRHLLLRRSDLRECTDVRSFVEVIPAVVDLERGPDLGLLDGSSLIDNLHDQLDFSAVVRDPDTVHRRLGAAPLTTVGCAHLVLGVCSHRASMCTMGFDGLRRPHGVPTPRSKGLIPVHDDT